jgi:hypothetical protein
MVIACPCGGGQGTQRCESSGTYSACTCTDAGTPVDAPMTASDAPATRPIYAGQVPNIGSVWSSEGMTGLAAGAGLCAGTGGDHVCDYTEVVRAASAGELAAIPMGTTAWLQRTTTVDVGGTPSPAGPGGNCNNWTFNGNHIADGEYITFDAAGVPTYHFDNDTAFDGIDTTHVTPGDLDCGTVMRAILCCNAP